MVVSPFIRQPGGRQGASVAASSARLAARSPPGRRSRTQAMAQRLDQRPVLSREAGAAR